MGLLHLVRDTILIAQSVGQKRLNVFSLPDGGVLGHVRYDGIVSSALSAGDTVWFGNLDAHSGHLLAGWSSVAPFGADTTPLSATRVEMPAAYGTNEGLRGTFGLVFGTAWADSLLVGVAGSDTIVLESGGGRVRLVPPVARRRGIPADFLDRLDLRKSTMAEIVGMASALFGVWRRDDGSFVLVHYDSELEGRTIRSRPWVSLLSPDLRRGCMDAALPTSGETQPKLVFVRDTLYVLDQYVVEGQDQGRVVLRRHALSDQGCSWLPVKRFPDKRN